MQNSSSILETLLLDTRAYLDSHKQNLEKKKCRPVFQKEIITSVPFQGKKDRDFDEKLLRRRRMLATRSSDNSLSKKDNKTVTASRVTSYVNKNKIRPSTTSYTDRNEPNFEREQEGLSDTTKSNLSRMEGSTNILSKTSVFTPYRPIKTKKIEASTFVPGDFFQGDKMFKVRSTITTKNLQGNISSPVQAKKVSRNIKRLSVRRLSQNLKNKFFGTRYNKTAESIDDQTSISETLHGQIRLARSPLAFDSIKILIAKKVAAGQLSPEIERNLLRDLEFREERFHIDMTVQNKPLKPFNVPPRTYGSSSEMRHAKANLRATKLLDIPHCSRHLNEESSKILEDTFGRTFSTKSDKKKEGLHQSLDKSKVDILFDHESNENKREQTKYHQTPSEISSDRVIEHNPILPTVGLTMAVDPGIIPKLQAEAPSLFKSFQVTKGVVQARARFKKLREIQEAEEELARFLEDDEENLFT